MNERHLHLVGGTSVLEQQMEALVEARRAQQRERLIKTALTLSQVVELTGSNESRLTHLISRQRLINFNEEGQLLMPPWQFRKNPLQPVIPEALQLVRVFPDPRLEALNAWVEKQKPEFHERSGAEMLQAGQGQLVVLAAQAIGAAGR